MAPPRSLRVAVVPDPGEPLEALAHVLTAAEREQARALPTERRRRHFVIGRLAARKAIRPILGGSGALPALEISSPPGCAPRVIMDGPGGRVRVSISHSSRLAAACAWFAQEEGPLLAGIDVEHTRPNEVAESSYAFSPRERRLLSEAQEGPEIAGLAAWTAKEAVWKALLAGQDIGPEAIEIRVQNLAQGRTLVRVKGALSDRIRDPQLWVRTRQIGGPDGKYVMSIAKIAPVEMPL